MQVTRVSRHTIPTCTESIGANKTTTAYQNSLSCVDVYQPHPSRAQPLLLQTNNNHLESCSAGDCATSERLKIMQFFSVTTLRRFLTACKLLASFVSHLIQYGFDPRSCYDFSEPQSTLYAPTPRGPTGYIRLPHSSCSPCILATGRQGRSINMCQQCWQ